MTTNARAFAEVWKKQGRTYAYQPRTHGHRYVRAYAALPGTMWSLWQFDATLPPRGRYRRVGTALNETEVTRFLWHEDTP